MVSIGVAGDVRLPAMSWSNMSMSDRMLRSRHLRPAVSGSGRRKAVNVRS